MPRVKVKQAIPYILKVPRRDLDQPGQFCKHSGTGAENGGAAFRIATITAKSKICISRSIKDNNKGEQSESTHDSTIDKHVGENLERKNTAPHIMRWSAHNI